VNSSLVDAILGSNDLGELRAQLAIRSVLSDFPVVVRSSELPAIPWSRALTLASSLAGEDRDLAQDAALRIAQGCLLADESEPHQREAAAIVLERMGNRPSIRLAAARDRVSAEAWEDAPAPLQLDVIRRRLELSIPVAGGDLVEGNPFQRRFWSAVERSRWVSVSAPTSAGKSYIVRRWFEERLAGRSEFTGVYIVPTRALIDEVSRDLAAQFTGFDVGVYSIPWDAEVGTRQRKILVLTQERLHLLQELMPSQGADLVFVDEAQKFGDGARGVLLQQAVEEALRRNPDLQLIFASPLTSNPEVLLQGSSDPSSTAVVTSESVTVNQNLIWADQVPGKPTRWTLRLVLDGEPADVGHLDLPSRPHPDSQRLPLVAVTLGAAGGGNVVYVNGAADAEKTARQIYDALGTDHDISNDSSVAALRDLVEKTIHSQYALATVLRRGVAFHYGNMPQLVRTEIERLFREGQINFLVCTSTLLEGVNLPCRNLFARNPKKGNGNPMKAADFWNLAGRAGRWGKEFQGNIICVDASRPERWPELPRTRTRQPVSRASSDALTDVDVVVAYVKAGAPIEVATQNPMLETIYSYLAARIVGGHGLGTLPDLPAESAVALETAIRTAQGGLEINDALITRHAGISPAAMQRLLVRFRSYSDPGILTLTLPESSDAVDAYTRALGLCDLELGSGFGTASRHFGLALLIQNWMRGYPLARLISGRIEYLRRNSKPIRLPNEIRNVMRDVEQIARFKAPKYLACYADVLETHAVEVGREDLLGGPDITMMLELGVSRETEVSLMALGLSRTAAVSLAEYIVADDLSRDEVRDWIQGHQQTLLALPLLVQREINAAVEPIQPEDD
jgi:hypothetical protein